MAGKRASVFPMEQHENVAIFWDFENCKPSATITGYDIVENIRCIAQTFGSVKLFKAYLDISQHNSPRYVDLRAQLQASGVSLTDCAHNGRQGVADKMLIVDMIAYMADNPTPATIILISGDRDYSYAIATLRLRRYRIVVISPPGTNNSLIAQASVHLDWNTEVLGQETPELPTPNVPAPAPPPPAARRRADSIASRPYTPSSRTQFGRNGNADDDEEDLYKSFDTFHLEAHEIYPYANGDAPVPSRYPPVTGSQSERRGPSRSQSYSKSYSPPGTSTQSSPPTPSRAYKTPEPTFSSSILYERPYTPSLPKGFPFSEPESITFKSPVAPTGPPSGVFHRPSMSDVAENKPETTAPPARSASAFEAFVPATKLPTLIANPSPPAQSAPVVPPLTAMKPLPESAPSAPAPAPLAFLPGPIPPAPSPAQAPVQVAPQKASASTPAVSAPQSKPTLIQMSAPTPAKVQPPVPPTTAPVAGPSSGSSGPASLRPVPSQFKTLVEVLELRRRSMGQARIPRTDLGTDLAKQKAVYAKAGVTTFAAYIALAVKAEVVEVGGSGNSQWVSTAPGWSF